MYGEIADSVAQNTAVHRCVSRLRPKTRLDVEREDPVTLEEAIAKAENVESIFWGSSYGGGRGGRGGHTTTVAYSARHTSSERQESPAPKVKQEELNKMDEKKSKIRCFKCGEHGHIRKHYTKLKKRVESTEDGHSVDGDRNRPDSLPRNTTVRALHN